MADIRLVRPEAGVNQNVACEPEANFVFDFPTDAATLSRNGDNLVMTFDDGATLSLTDFYKSYTSKNMPDFEVDGAKVAGSDFFTAMNEPDLMPAAGPSASAPGGGRFHQYENMALYDGLDRLGGLDVGWQDGGYERELDGGAGVRGDDVGNAGDDTDSETGNRVPSTPEDNHVPSITPTDPDRPGFDPETPVIPQNPDDPDNPGGDPGTGGADPGLPRDVLLVHESGLPDGSQANSADAPTLVQGSMHVESPDGVASLQVGGKTVYENGKFIEGVEIVTDEGVLRVTGYDESTGTLSYEYELERSSQEHSAPGQDKIGHNITVEVTDPDGDSASSTITVVVQDDAPDAVNDGAHVLEGESISGNVLANDKYGADDLGKFNEEGAPQVKWNLDGYNYDKNADGSYTVHTEYGDATLRSDGTWDFAGKGNDDFKQGTHDLKFEYSIVDKDGDTDTAELTITLEADDHEPTITPDPDKESTYPDGSSAHIVMDEGHNPESSTKNDTSDSDAHTGHTVYGDTGTGHFNVQLNGESGTITLTDKDGKTVELHVDADGNYTLSGPGNSPLPAGGITLQVNGIDVQFATSGKLSANQDGSWQVEYSYSLSGPQAHDSTAAGAGKADDHTLTGGEITITVTDETGDTATGKLTSEVHDDVAIAVDDGAQTLEGGSASGNVLSNDDYGADGDGKFSEEGAPQVRWNLDGYTYDKNDDGSYTVHTEYGDATLRPDGTWSFAGKGNEDFKEGTHDLKFEYTIVDKDGDTDTAELTITLKADDHEPTITPDPDKESTYPDGSSAHIVMDEGHNQESHDNNDTVDSGPHTGHTVYGSTGTGHFNVQLNGESGTITLTDEYGHTVELHVDADGNYTLSGPGNSPLPADGITLQVNGIEVQFAASGQLSANQDGSWQVEYSYSLSGPQTHEKTGEGDHTLTGDEITITVTDATGDTATGKMTSEVHDDVPTLTVTTPVINANLDQPNQGEVTVDDNGVTLHGQLDWTFGADNGDNARVTVTYTDDENNTHEVEGKLQEDGSYTFDIDGNTLTLYGDHFDYNVGGTWYNDTRDFEFQFKVEDNDGDQVTAGFKASVTGESSEVVVGGNNSYVREVGVRGAHYDGYDPNHPDEANGDILGNASTGGSIIWDGGNITDLQFSSGSVKHYNNDHESKLETTTDSLNSDSLGNGVHADNPNITLYVVKEGDNFNVVQDKPEGDDYYGELHLHSYNGQITWDFQLNNANKDLINSLNEGEKIEVHLDFFVNGNESLKNSLDFTIKGTDDQPLLPMDTQDNPYVQNSGTGGTVIVEDEGVSGGIGYGGTLHVGKHGNYSDSIVAPKVTFTTESGDEAVLFNFLDQTWWDNGGMWSPHTFVLNDGSILHVQYFSDPSAGGWNFNYWITPGENGTVPEITVNVYNDNENIDHYSLTGENPDVGSDKFNSTGAEFNGRFNNENTSVPDRDVVEQFVQNHDESGNLENMHYAGAKLARARITCQDPDADGMWIHANENGLNDSFGNGEIGFLLDGKRMYWGSDANDESLQELVNSFGNDKVTFGVAPADSGIPEGNYIIIESTYGSYYVDKYGNLYYLLDTSEGGKADQLAEGEVATDGVFFQTRDQHGAFHGNSFTVHVRGTNEAPTLDITNVTEAAVVSPDDTPGEASSFSGTVVGTDRDNGETDQLEYFLVDPKTGELVKSVQTEHGSVSIDDNGNFVYTLNTDDPDVNSLKDYDNDGGKLSGHQEGVDFLRDSFTVGVRDPHGAVDLKEQDVTIKGSNKAPHIDNITDSSQGFQLKETGVTVDDSNDNLLDPNIPNMHDNPGAPVLAGKVEADDINKAGVDKGWSSNDLTFSFSIDGVAAAKDQVIEDTTFDDVVYNHAIETEYGTFYYNDHTGDYRYELDPDKSQQLHEGEIVGQNVQVQVLDDNGASAARDFTIQIVGTNDAPRFVKDGDPDVDEDNFVVMKEEDGKYTAHLTAIDEDNDGGNNEQGNNLDYTFKGSEWDAQGQIGPNPGINQSQSYDMDLGTFFIDDQHDGTVTFTQNDTSALRQQARSFLNNLFVRENGAIKIGTDGKPEIQDGYKNDLGKYFKFTESNGLEFTAAGWAALLAGDWADDSDFYQWLQNYLANNDNVEVRDGNIYAKADVYAVDQYGAADSVEVAVKIEPPTVPGPGRPIVMPDHLVYGSFDLQEPGWGDDGHGNNIPLGDQPGDTKDGVDVKETDTWPEPADRYGFSFVETESARATDPDGDNKYVDLSTSSQSIETPWGTLTIDPETGRIEFLLDTSSADVQALQNGEALGNYGSLEEAIQDLLKQYLDKYSIAVYDEASPGNNRYYELSNPNQVQDLKITIKGADTTPEMTLDTPVLDVEAGAITATEKPTVTDRDTEDDRLTYDLRDRDGNRLTDSEGNELQPDQDGILSYENEYGIFHLNTRTGEYWFEANGAGAKNLAEGQSATFDLSITVSDEHSSTSQDVTVQLHGQNDAPEILYEVDGKPVTYEHGVTDAANSFGKAEGKIEANDPDRDALSYSVGGVTVDGQDLAANGNIVETEYGTFTLHPDGSYTFESNGRATEGQNVQVEVTVDVSDDHGLSTQQTLTFNLQGADDPTKITGDGGTLNYDNLGASNSRSFSGRLEVSDLDDPNLNITDFNFKNADGSISEDNWDDGKLVLHGKYGDLTVYKDGSYTYSVSQDGYNELTKIKKGEASGDLWDQFGMVDKKGDPVDHDLTFDFNMNRAPEVHVNKSENDPFSGTCSWTDPDGDYRYFELAVNFAGQNGVARNMGNGVYAIYGVGDELENILLGTLTIKSDGKGGYNYHFDQDENWQGSGDLKVDLTVVDSSNNKTSENLIESHIKGDDNSQPGTISADDDNAQDMFALAAPEQDNADDLQADAVGDGQTVDSLIDSSSEDMFASLDSQAANGQDGAQDSSSDNLTVYNSNDMAISGGDNGIDILLSNGTEDTLDKLLGNSPNDGDNGPMVQDVQAFLKDDGSGKAEERGFEVEDLASLKDLAEKAHISVENDTLTFGDDWKVDAANNMATNADLGLTVELSADMQQQTDQQVFILNNNQGA